MGKVIRLTESQLKNVIKRVISEQGIGLDHQGQDKYTPEGGGDEQVQDFDHFGKIVLPQMKRAGFKLVDESSADTSIRCKYYDGNCCKYFAYPDHNNGVNLFLSCEDGGWKYVVFTHPGSKNLKEFKWMTGTTQEVKNAAQQAVNYAISLKTRMFSK